MLPHKHRKIKATDHLLSSFSYINQLICYFTMKSRHTVSTMQLTGAVRMKMAGLYNTPPIYISPLKMCLTNGF